MKFTYSKEKNIIKLTRKDKRGYKIDINQGILYGIGNHPLKKIPAISFEIDYSANNYKILPLVLADFLNNCDSLTEKQYEKLLLADKIDNALQEDSTKVYTTLANTIIWYSEGISFIQQNFKKFIKFLKTLDKCSSDINLFQTFKTTLLLTKVEEKIKQKHYESYKTQLLSICKHMIVYYSEVWETYLEEILYYCVHDLIDTFTCVKKDEEDNSFEGLDEYAVASLLGSFLSKCKEMEYMPPKDNFSRINKEVVKNYVVFKKQKDMEFWSEYTEKIKKYHFEAFGYTTIFPISAKDLVKEGQNQHNCVAGYIDDLKNNRTHIVFIRKKDEPDKSLITCEFRTNGQGIIQFLAQYNKNVSSEDLIKFKQAFDNFLCQQFKQEGN